METSMGEMESWKKWRSERRKLSEAREGGATYVSSMGPVYYAEDKGRGIYTSGVNTCVALSSGRELAHLGADWLVREPEQIGKMVEKFRDKGEIEMFGLPGSAMWEEAERLVKEKGIVAKQHRLESEDESFVVIVKNGQTEYFVDRPL